MVWDMHIPNSNHFCLRKVVWLTQRIKGAVSWDKKKYPLTFSGCSSFHRVPTIWSHWECKFPAMGGCHNTSIIICQDTLLGTNISHPKKSLLSRWFSELPFRWVPCDRFLEGEIFSYSGRDQVWGAAAQLASNPSKPWIEVWSSKFQNFLYVNMNFEFYFVW